jgi:hypothetical protein
VRQRCIPRRQLAAGEVHPHPSPVFADRTALKLPKHLRYIHRVRSHREAIRRSAHRDDL